MKYIRGTRKLFSALLALAIIAVLPSCEKKEKVENLGIFGFSRNRKVLGQDGCTPIPMGNVMMWTFGDTILGSWKGTLSLSSTFEETAIMKGMISNSLAFTEIPDDNTIKNLQFRFYEIDGRVAQFIRYNPGEDARVLRLWPVDGIRIGSTVYVYYYMILIGKGHKQKKGETGFPPLINLGTGIAEWEVPASWKISEPVNFKRTVTIFSGEDPSFGDCVEKRGDYLYIIGRGLPVNGRTPAFIARVQASEIKNRKAYRFLDKNYRWSIDIGSSRPFFNDVAGELSLSYNEYLKENIIIYCSLNGAIKYDAFTDYSRLKSTHAQVLYVPAPLPRIESRPMLFYYSGKEIFHTRNRIYAIYINPAIYQPILLEIPYSSITK